MYVRVFTPLGLLKYRILISYRFPMYKHDLKLLSSTLKNTGCSNTYVQSQSCPNTRHQWSWMRACRQLCTCFRLEYRRPPFLCQNSGQKSSGPELEDLGWYFEQGLLSTGFSKNFNLSIYKQ